MTKKIILPPGFNLDKAYALQRLMDDPNHKEAMDYIINDICSTYSDPTDPANTHMTYRNIGRASVGREIIQNYKLNLSKIKQIMSKEKKDA